MPAFAHAIAMPPPIVPAPTIATRSTASAASSFVHVRAPSPRRARRRRRGAAPCTARSARISADSSRSRRHPSSNGSVTAASIASTTPARRGRCGFVLRAVSRAAANSGAFSAGVPSRSARSRRSRRQPRRARAASRANADRRRLEIARRRSGRRARRAAHRARRSACPTVPCRAPSRRRRAAAAAASPRRRG